MPIDVERSATRRVEGVGTVLVVDSSPGFAEALTQLLQDSGLDAAHASFTEARSAASALQPKLLLLDGDQPWPQVLACAGGVSAVCTDTRILLLVSSSERWPEALARRVRALGWVSRGAGADVLLEAIRCSSTGGRPPVRSHGLPSPHFGPLPGRAPLGGLTAREQEILEALCGGMRDDAIAGELGISVNTVRTHVQNVLGKLAVHNRHEAVTLALSAGVRPARGGRAANGHRQR